MNSHKSKADRLLELQSQLVKFAEIERMIHFPDGKHKDRQENDAEHSYSLAMAVWYLAEHFPQLNRDKMIRYALAHDFVELHAGDEMAIGRTKEAEKQKLEREKHALKQLEQDWPDFPELTSTIRDYEKHDNPESRFVYALDKLMPMLLNLLSGGKTWQTYKLKRADVLANKDTKTRLSPEVNELWSVFREQILSNDTFFKHELTNN